ncbi:MAG: NHL repeat-containing protein [Candidatus Dormibacteria bacterium]
MTRHGVLAGMALAVCATAPATAHAGTAAIITTVVGGPGNGSVTSVATRPCGILVHGTVMYVADSFWRVVRRVDLSTGTSTVMAGDGSEGDGPDGIPATKAQFNEPCSLALDHSGNLYIADTGNNRVRRVGTDGTLTTLAGTGAFSHSGDGGPATQAAIAAPTGLCLDAFGHLDVVEHGQSTVRSIDLSTGVITTIAGEAGNPGFSGDGGPATAAQLDYPQDISCASDGTLYVADSGSFRVREISTSGVISTLAGNGNQGSTGDGGPSTSAEVGYMYGIAAGASGDVYLSDSPFNRVRLIRNGVITTVVGDGTPGYSGDGGVPSSAEVNNPSGLSYDNGVLYVADEYNQRVRAVSSLITTVSGNGTIAWGGDGGPATDAQLRGPADVALGGDGSMYIADAFNDRVRRVSPEGIVTTFAGNGLDPGVDPSGSIGDGGPATQAMLYSPQGVAVGPDGSVYVAEMLGARVRRIAPDGTITTYAGDGKAGFSGDGGPASAAEIEFPIGIAVNRAGDLYIADSFNNRVRVVAHDTGTISTFAGGAPTLNTVLRSQACSYDNGLSGTDTELIGPARLTFDSAGNLYVSDYGNNRVRRYTPAGAVTTVAGDCQAGETGDGGPATSADLQGPTGLAVDGSGNLYISDNGNDCIRLVNPEGIISVYAGVCEAGYRRAFAKYGGDGGPALQAQMSFPQGLALDVRGRLLMSDYGNGRVRLIDSGPAAALPEMPPLAGLPIACLAFAAIAEKRRRRPTQMVDRPMRRRPWCRGNRRR